MADASRWLDREALAEYVSVRPAAVARLVKEGRLPAPSYQFGARRPRWDRAKVDAAFDGGLASTDPATAVQGLVSHILAEGRSRRSSQAR
jgi:predicted DNA-binding transcriptional regulator AlpA